MGREIDRRDFLRRAAGAAAAGGAGGARLAGPGAGLAGAASKPKSGGSMTIGVEAEEDGFDAAQVTWDSTGIIYARTVYDSLAVIAANGSVQPYLAQSITPNADYTQWVVTARPNITFHNGTPLDANALLANAEALASSAIVGPALANIASVTVSGPLSITFTMKEPWIAFPYGLTSQAGMVAEPSTLKDGSAMQHPVGTGPFVFSEWVPGDHFTATKNPNYWQSGLPYLDSITYRPIVDVEARSNSLKSGTVQMILSSDAQTIHDFTGNSSYKMITDLHKVIGETDQIFLMLNTGTPPLTDSRVRQALAYAIDPKLINDTIGYGIAPLSTGPFTQGTPLYVPTGYPQYNVDKAKALVSAAEKSLGPINLQLGVTNTGRNVQLMELVQAQLQQVGIKSTITEVQQADYITNALFGKYQLYLWRQFGTPNPDSNYIFWTSPTAAAEGAPALNFARNKDPLLDQAMNTGRSNPSATARTKAYQSVSRRFAVDLPFLWLTRAVWASVSSPSVGGLLTPKVPTGGLAYPFISGVFFPQALYNS